MRCRTPSYMYSRQTYPSLSITIFKCLADSIFLDYSSKENCATHMQVGNLNRSLTLTKQAIETQRVVALGILAVPPSTYERVRCRWRKADIYPPNYLVHTPRELLPPSAPNFSKNQKRTELRWCFLLHGCNHAGWSPPQHNVLLHQGQRQEFFE